MIIIESFEGYILDVLIKKQHYINLINKVKDVSGAIQLCKEQNIDISKIIFEKSDSASLRAFKELQIIARALNEGWKPNWVDINEYKYYPIFKYKYHCFEFSEAYYCNRSAPAGFSLLCLKSSPLAEYIGRTFIHLYKDYLK